MPSNNVIGLFTRHWYEQHDTSRQCCDSRCNDNQGRGGCPLVPASMPKRAPRIPRTRIVPERRTSPVIRWVLWSLVALALVLVIADSVAIQGLQ